MLTARKLRRLETWTNWRAAGGARAAILADVAQARATENLQGTGALTFVLPLGSRSATAIARRTIIRVDHDDLTFDEWKVVQIADDRRAGTRTVTCADLRTTDLAEAPPVSRVDGDGVVSLRFESVGLTPAQHIAAWVIPALAAAGLTFVSAGVITPTWRIDLTFDWSSPLAVLLAIAEKTGMELDIRRVASTGYAIDLLPKIGSSAPIVDVRLGRNIQDGLQHGETTLQQATRLYPKGAGNDDAAATIARAVWQTTAVASPGAIALADPAGGAGPIGFDGQLVGNYLRTSAGILHAITASSASAQTVTIGANALTVGELVQFREDAAGKDLTYLDHPAARTADGGRVKVGSLVRSDIPGTNNLLKNSVLRTWPGSAAVLPAGWTAVGTPTVARTIAAPFTVYGGQSAKLDTTADGHGMISDAVPITPTALAPFLGGFGFVWGVSGSVRAELVFTTPSGTKVVPIAPSVASLSVLGQWEQLGVSGIDAHAIAATAVALRIVQRGSGTASFYVDGGQVTEGAAQQPFVEGSGGTQLWQEANLALATLAVPEATYLVPIVDLEALDPATFGADCTIVLGAVARVNDPMMVLLNSMVRIVEYTRDYLNAGATTLTLSSKPSDLTGNLSATDRAARAAASVGDLDSTPLAYNNILAKVTASDATTVTVTVTATSPAGAPTVQYVGVTGSATKASGPAAGVPSASGTVWVFNRGTASGGIGQAQFRAIFPGNVDDDDFATIPEQAPVLQFTQVLAAITASNATTETVTVTATPAGATVELVSVTGSATKASGPNVGVASASGTVWVFNRGAALGGDGQAQFRAVLAGYQSDDDLVLVPEQGSSVVLALLARARVLGNTATTITVRVAVADPSPGGTATIAYQDQGTGGVSPASGGTVTPAATLTEAAGTFIDYTITRPAFGAGAGRVTFTVTEGGRVADVDAVDVPEADRDTVFLASRARVLASNGTQVIVRYAVADPYPQGANSVTSSYQAQGTGSVTPTSGGTITPAATLTEAAGTFIDYTIDRPAFGTGTGRVTFTATAAGRVSDSDAVEVPAIERDTKPLAMRILRVSETDTDMVVRIEVISPVAGASVTVAYLGGGLTITPASGGSLAATTDFATTAHIDYTITRASTGGTPRRVAFTASAVGYVDATDGVDVTPAGGRSRCKVFMGLAPSIANATLTLLNFDGEVYDVGGLHDTVTNNSRITVPAGGDVGVWCLTASISFDGSGTGGHIGNREVIVRKNGTTNLGRTLVPAANNDSGAFDFTIINVIGFDDVPAVGDYYEVLVKQTSGGARFLISTVSDSFFAAVHLW